jgi:hypothetical protein
MCHRVHTPGDTAITFAANPLFLSFPIDNSWLKNDKVQNLINRLKTDSTLVCMLVITRGSVIKASMIGQLGMHRFLSKLRVNLIERNAIKNDVFFETDFSPEPCVYKSFNLPCVSITVSHNVPKYATMPTLQNN